MPNNPNNYLIGGNDEHGIDPPTIGKRTPVMPYINRQVYENEFNYAAKNFFLEACLRCGFNVFDVKPERQDVSITQRVIRVNRQGLSALMSFAFNASGDGNTFTSGNGLEVFYSVRNPRPLESRTISMLVYEQLVQGTPQSRRGVKALDIGMLSSVNCPSSLVEAGFMTNFQEAKLMLDPDFQKEVGEDCCKGMCQYFDVVYIPPYVSTPGLPLLRPGSTGNRVKMLQYRLLQTGYSSLVDGAFGSQTTQAVKRFQMENGLSPDGIVGANTWNKLFLLNTPAQLLKSGSTGAYVNYLQKKLYAKLYPLVIDNDFGASTLTAVRTFQRENGLTADGVVGRGTWNKLMPIGGGRPFPT